MASNNTVPAPFSVSPSWSWDGDDGSWSTFSINVGTPPQSFRVLPSTTGSNTWVPIIDGCGGFLSSVADCGTLRGANDFNGEPSRGFESNASSTWDLLGIYELATEQNLWGKTGNSASYGLDTVSLGKYPSGSSPDLSDQIVAATAVSNVWLGSMGLGTSAASVVVEGGDIPGLLATLKNRTVIPSLSFGYTAGASYSSPQNPGSLVLGGYDQARFKPSDISFPLGGVQKQSLAVQVESVIVENAFGGTLALLPGGKAVSTIIDSTTSQMWLPQNVCDQFAQAFGLTYDLGSGLYLVNRTVHHQLQQMNPSITFAVGSTDSSLGTTNIVLPYAAFDLQAGLPLFSNTTNYFPLRVAANESQQVLGRTFLQEAYVAVDWERGNFTIGQAIHQNTTTDIIPVLPQAQTSDTTPSTLSTAAIAGIAAGGGVLLIIAIVFTFFFIRRRRRRTQHIAEYRKDDLADLPVELHDVTKKPSELPLTRVYEVSDAGNSKFELSGEQATELPGESLQRELEGEGLPDGRIKEKWNGHDLAELE